MSSNPNIEQGDTHIATLLPWYINGKLCRQEREAVEVNLLRSSSLRRKLQVWQCIAQYLQAGPENATAERSIWDRLQTSFEADQQYESTSETIPSTKIRRRYWPIVVIPAVIAFSLTALLTLFILSAAVPTP